MTRKDMEQDEISKLLDSFDVDEALENRMDAIAQKNEAMSRANKQKSKEAEIPSFANSRSESVGDTRIILGANDRDAQPIVKEEPKDVSGTMAFNPNKIENRSKQATSGTVVINDKEIKSLLEEDKGPKLTRKKVSKDDGVHLKKKTKPVKTKEKANGKIIAVVVASILGVLLAGLLIFGVVKIVQNFTDQEISTEVQEKYYKEISEWALDYNTYSDKEKLDIIDYEKKFNKLSDEQKKKIDRILVEQTGSTFDELLAKAKSKKKEDSKNNNTEEAQKKAELKEKINDLKTELNGAKNTLAEAQTELERARGELNEANTTLSQAQSTFDGYNSIVNSTDIRSLEAQYNTLYQQYLDTDYEDQETREMIWSQLEAIKAKANEYEVAYNNLQAAQNTLNTAKNVATQAQSNYDSANAKVSSAQKTVDDINSKISQYQAKLDDLD